MGSSHAYDLSTPVGRKPGDAVELALDPSELERARATEVWRQVTGEDTAF